MEGPVVGDDGPSFAEGDSLGPRLDKDLLRDRSDEELMALWVDSRRSGRGNAAAFELLWERHRSATYQAVTRVLGRHRGLADEVLQDAWLEVARAGRYQPGSFRSFIRTIATRKALDRLAAASIRTTAVPEDRDGEVGDDALERAASDAPDPGRGARAREGAALVLEIVETMPHAQRAAWILKYVEQMTFEELAEVMGTPVGTAKTRIRLANALLAQGLEERGIAPSDLEEEP